MKKAVFLFVLIVIAAFILITNCSKKTATTAVDSSALATVPGGTFTQTNGTISFIHTISSFKIGKYPVTYYLWYMVYQWAIANGYAFQNAGTEGNKGKAGAAPTAAQYQPVTTVNWRDAIVWCNAYSQKSGLIPVYYSDAGFTAVIKSSAGMHGENMDTTPGSSDNPYANWSANGYRLPTEGEYQYTASYINGTNWTPYNYASGATADYTNAAATGLVAWYNANSGSTQDVGGKTANAFGIYDMSGNVFEWCWDWYDNYHAKESTNYRGPASGTCRVMRGGSCVLGAEHTQVGFRDSNYLGYPYYKYSNYFGFRFARND